MDSHHVGRGRKSIESALQSIKAETLVMGIESDILFPIAEQEFLASTIPGAQFEKIDSSFGHDGFLVEIDQFKKILKKFRSQKKSAAAILK